MIRRVPLRVVQTLAPPADCPWCRDEHLRKVLKVTLRTLRTQAAMAVRERDSVIAYLEGVVAQLETGCPSAAAVTGVLLLALDALEHVQGASGVRASVHAAARRVFNMSLEASPRGRRFISS